MSKLHDLYTLLSSLPADEMNAARLVFKRVTAERSVNHLNEMKISEGSKVQFVARGRLWIGTVERINPKTTTVRCLRDGMLPMVWKVSHSFLRLASGC